jgi:hypothetical protein
MLCMLGSHHVHRDKIHKIFMLVRIVEVSECRTGVVRHQYGIYEYDGIPTCIAFTDSPIKKPEDDLYVGRNM